MGAAAAREYAGTQAAAAAAGGEAAPAQDEALEPAHAECLNDPIILGPPKDCTADEATATLLVLAPGALLPASDFTQLAEALQAALKERVRLTVGILDLNWGAVMNMKPGKAGWEPMLVHIALVGVDEILDKAAAHMDLKAGGTGRRDNVFVAGHSALGPALVRYALEKAGGLALLASTMLPAVSDTYPTASTWTRPVLNLCAELDGQQYLTKQAPAVAEAAAAAAAQGLRHVAAFQPIVVIPGMNHAQFGSGTEKKLFPGAPPLDLEPDISHEDATQQAAAVLADFLTAHRGAAAAAAAATEALQRRVFESAALAAPFLEAQGRGHVLKALEALEAEPELPLPRAAAAAGLVPGAVGGEVLRGTEASRQWLAHPGEVGAAEAFAIRAQREALAALPEPVTERVIVTATVHTDAATFLYNQPTIEAISGGRVFVRVHIYMWRHALETQERVQPAVGAEYALKTRTASAVCRALGEHELAEQQTSGFLSAADINARTFQAALEMVPASVRERYERRGKRFVPVLDRRVEGQTAAPDWVQRERVTFTDVSDTDTQVCAPFVNTQKEGEPVPRFDSYSRGVGRFVGNHYIKVLSLARCVEWLMIDALRPRKLPPPQGPPPSQ